MNIGIDKIRIFYDGYLDKLKTVNNRHERVFISFNKLIPTGIRVLDVGCGTGITSKYLAEGNRMVTAVDLSPKLIEYAKEHNNHGRIQYIVSDITTWFESKEEKYDAIVLVDVLEHILKKRMRCLFESIEKLSHKDTKIYVNIPTADILRFLQEHKPETRQIVDNPIETGNILKMFFDIGFVPIYMQLYWQHYMEYLFITKEIYNETFKGVFVNG